MSDLDVRAAQVWETLRTLVLERYDRRGEVCAEMGMSFFRVKVLRRVAQGPSTMSELVERVGSDAPYVSVVVDDLARRGYVTRTSHPDDRRRKIVAVTPEGAAAAARADAVLSRPPDALTTLNEADMTVLERTLARLTED